MLEPFGEVDGDVPEYFSLGKDFSKRGAVKNYREKIILKYHSWIYLCELLVSKLKFGRLTPNIAVVCFVKNGSFHPNFYYGKGGGAKLLFLTPKCEISIQN